MTPRLPFMIHFARFLDRYSFTRVAVPADTLVEAAPACPPRRVETAREAGTSG